MPRFQPYTQPDTFQVTDGDQAFTGVHLKGEPEQVQPGLLRDMVNGTCRDGTARTRLGSQTPTSLQAPANPQTVFGSGVFSDPNGTEWLLLACAGTVWKMRDGFTPTQITTPATLAGPVKFVQAFSTVILFRGSALVPWSWDGDIAHGFAEISQEIIGSTQPIPNGPDTFGLNPLVMFNRLIVPYGRSQIAMSDLLDYTRYDGIFADFNVTGGNDNTLTGIYRYTGGNLLILNDQSVQLLSGLDSGNLSLQPLNDTIGCISGATIATMGNTCLWLGSGAVWPLTEVDLRREVAPVPMSDPIEPTMQRIAWKYANKAVAMTHEDTYYLAVPFEGSTCNNVILPYDSLRQAWCGMHTFPTGVRFDALHRLDWFGRKRLHGVDYATGRVHLLYEGRHDYVGNTRHDIAFSATTRAYLLQIPERKRITRGRVYGKTWAPRTTVTVATDGVAESTVPASALTRDRSRSMVFGRADYDQSNVNGDHGQPYRQDYTVNLDTAIDPDPSSGIDFELEQHHRIPFTLKARGRYASLTVSNDQGTLAITALALEGQPADTTDRPAN